MAWDGQERRNSSRGFCEGHLTLCEDMAIVKTTVINLDKNIIAMDKRINGSVNDMKKHMEGSKSRNLTIALSFIGVVLFLFNLSASLGESKRQLEINTKRWDRLFERQNNYLDMKGIE